MKSALFTAVPLMLLLAGCSQTFAPERTLAPASIISYNAAVKLEQLRPGQTVLLGATPWGDNINVTALERYRSASGFDCLKLQLTNQKALACQTADNLWLAEQAYAQ
ncbi:DVU3141 family protein [Rheinheimera maricola]|uniref:Common-antigen outer membrane protein n=1 Tax=Rheinheimera maricola TaxID=2793282 RepID=A0ABS7X412_9GAMM|nr:DVU3141 family protein [Rheinheimera maricola]MBZ9610299.1 hypothetical protein [Rheinheimera maricola]